MNRVSYQTMRRRTRVKICGVRTAEDALAAAEAGADAVGIVLHPAARRHVTLASAEAIVAALPPFVTPVALFVDERLDCLYQAVCQLRIGTVQLHGGEHPDLVRQLAPLRIMKAIHADPASVRRELAAWKSAASALPNLAGIVLDTACESGGSGVPNDWALVESLRDEGLLEGLPPLVAAGGLRPENVADVVRRLRPWGVDVSSGVESEPLHKSRSLIEDFIAAVRAADEQTCAQGA